MKTVSEDNIINLFVFLDDRNVLGPLQHFKGCFTVQT